MDSLPVKQVRGHIPWAPEVLPCSKEHLQPFLPPRRGSPLDSFAVLPSCCACPLIDGMRAGPWQRAGCMHSPGGVWKLGLPTQGNLHPNIGSL